MGTLGELSVVLLVTALERGGGVFILLMRKLEPRAQDTSLKLTHDARQSRSPTVFLCDLKMDILSVARLRLEIHSFPQHLAALTASQA